MRKTLFRTGIVLALLLCGMELPSAQACGCEDNWTAGARGVHSGCQAGPIDAGLVSYAGSTLYRHHNAPYTKASNSDKDCHQKTDCSYEDVAEDTFTCSWKLQRYESGNWTDAGTISGDCTGANWDTEAHEPGKEYRAKAFTNDTSGDGPYGDDAGVYRYSAGQMLWAPGVDDWDHDDENYCLGIKRFSCA